MLHAIKMTVLVMSFFQHWKKRWGLSVCSQIISEWSECLFPVNERCFDCTLDSGAETSFLQGAHVCNWLVIQRRSNNYS